jgi:hypothetical protein
VVSIIDGTLIPFATRPIRYGEDYYSWKTTYIISTMIVCNKKVEYCYFSCIYSWFSCLHNFKIVDNFKGFYFCEEEHLLVEFTYPLLLISTPIYKQLITTQPLNVIFNTQLAKFWIKIEYWIGVLKGRFQNIKDLHIQIETKRNHNKTMLCTT